MDLEDFTFDVDSKIALMMGSEDSEVEVDSE